MAIDHRRLITAVKPWLRAVGGLYVLGVVLGGVAQLAVHSGVRLLGAAHHVDAQPATPQVTLVADIAMAALFATVGIALYLLFRQVDRSAAGRAVTYVAVGVGMVLVNSLFHLAGLLGRADPLHDPLSARTSGGLVERLLTMHDHGYTIAGVFFGLCLLPLGYLAYRSSRIPPVLSALLTVSWLLATLLRLLWPDLPAVVHTTIGPPPVAELWLILYVVAKGAPRRSPTTRGTPGPTVASRASGTTRRLVTRGRRGPLGPWVAQRGSDGPPSVAPAPVPPGPPRRCSR